MDQLTNAEIEVIQRRTLSQIFDFKLRADLAKVFSMAASKTEAKKKKNKINFAMFMAEARKHSGLKQDELASKLNVPPFYVQQIERGKRIPAEVSEIAAWLKALGEIRKFSKACELYEVARKAQHAK